jgi:hypothetical protein
VDRMNAYFGALLRDEVVKYIDNAQFKRRAGSTGSQRLSSDSSNAGSVDGRINTAEYVKLGRIADGIYDTDSSDDSSDESDDS